MIYLLQPVSNKRFSYIPDDLRYIHTHFIGKAMADDWELPPVTVNGKSYKVSDFVGWMLRAPIISERARSALANICDGLVEFLRWYDIKKKPYYAMNVLSFDQSMPIHKRDAMSKIYVDERFGAVLRDHNLTGVALANTDDSITMRKILLGEDLNLFPGLLG